MVAWPYDGFNSKKQGANVWKDKDVVIRAYVS
jgi:hypothetical protein